MTPCEVCKQPNHCTGTYPDDDEHRPGQVRGCFAEKTLGVSFRSTETTNVIAADKTLGSDLSAYKRLKDDGVQPPRIDGASQREMMSEKHHIEEKPSPRVLERLEHT